MPTGSSLITASDFPDADVIRAGDTYYLVSTTMHFSPGCAILRSYDLIHWEWCGHVFDTLDDSDAQALRNGQNRYGKGMWAPSLRWRDGIFYVCFAFVDGGQTLIYRTENIETGPWEKTALPGMYHDPSLFFDDDGKAYLIYGNSVLRILELNPALDGLQPGGLNQALVRMAPQKQLGYEGTHFYKINGKYILLTIHSLPDRWRRVESCLTSDSLTGPYTGGIVFNDDLGYCGQGIAQGGIVDTPDGRWYAVFFQDRGAVGRAPVLLPMTWEAGMPVIGQDGKAPKEVENTATRPGHVYTPLARNDNFETPALNAMWEWNHAPDNSLWRTGNGFLSLTTGRVDRELTQARNTLTVRCADPVTQATVRVDGSALRPGDRAGICALQYHWSALALRRTEDGWRLSLLRQDDAQGEILLADVPASSQVTLKAVFDFTDMRDTVRFYYRDQETWLPIGDPQKLSFDLRHFAGVRIGLFCYAAETPGGEARFSKFTYAP